MRKDPAELFIEWSEKIKAQKLSTKNAAAWCREQGISYNTFQYWVGRIRKKTPENTIKNTFLEIPEELPFVEISLRGVKLSISRDFDRRAFVDFIGLLKVESC